MRGRRAPLQRLSRLPWERRTLALTWPWIAMLPGMARTGLPRWAAATMSSGALTSGARALPP